MEHFDLAAIQPTLAVETTGRGQDTFQYTQTITSFIAGFGANNSDPQGSFLLNFL
jgi:hypothetical protein